MRLVATRPHTPQCLLLSSLHQLDSSHQIQRPDYCLFLALVNPSLPSFLPDSLSLTYHSLTSVTLCLPLPPPKYTFFSSFLPPTHPISSTTITHYFPPLLPSLPPAGAAAVAAGGEENNAANVPAGRYCCKEWRGAFRNTQGWVGILSNGKRHDGSLTSSLAIKSWASGETSGGKRRSTRLILR